jgi:hypothetical protein
MTSACETGVSVANVGFVPQEEANTVIKKTKTRK